MTIECIIITQITLFTAEIENMRCYNNQNCPLHPQKNKAAGQYPAAFNQYTLQRPLAARQHE